MRTTLTLDDDICRRIDQIAVRQNRRKKAVVNELLRIGIEHLEEEAGKTATKTAGRDLGSCRLANIDDISEVLAVAEGEARR